MNKTQREIELEKKLEIAVKALEFYADCKHFGEQIYGINGKNETWWEGNVEQGIRAQKALEEIEG